MSLLLHASDGYHQTLPQIKNASVLGRAHTLAFFIAINRPFGALVRAFVVARMLPGRDSSSSFYVCGRIFRRVACVEEKKKIKIPFSGGNNSRQLFLFRKRYNFSEGVESLNSRRERERALVVRKRRIRKRRIMRFWPITRRNRSEKLIWLLL